ncbi:MAG: 3-isopropylmalate dehydratase [Desulfobulbus propionicus]|nr:MAG: 3-isopropylmalate dehydratase [Desulfobulbus propionicus]
MKKFGGQAAFIDRDDINTDEIIPARYLTEITKRALEPHLLEDLHLEGQVFDPQSEELKQAEVLVTRSNFGCGSSREHAVWALEVNDINVVIGQSFARIFRQNMFNCGILAVELEPDALDQLFALNRKEKQVEIAVDLIADTLTATAAAGKPISFTFTLNPFDKKLVEAGGWLNFADANY